jgi:transcriptional regulator with GAF, ATPase, and Fis domain
VGRLLTIYEIGQQLLEHREPDQVIRTIYRSLFQQLDPDHAVILLVQGEGNYQPLTAHHPFPEKAEEPSALSRSVLQRAEKTGLAVLATDTRLDERFSTSTSINKLHIRSILCVPLGKEPVRALVYADRRSRKRLFNREDLEFLTALSVYTALALERTEELVRTAEALRESDEQLELTRTDLLRHQIVGSSAKLLAAYDALRRFARTGANVLLRGETGTGKELFAKAYAANSDRYGKAYVPVAIPTLPATLVESELFGYVKGAFTEAVRDKKGHLEMADGGVLFLDEVGDIEPQLQAKLLRFLDSGELYRVGDTSLRRVDVRVVAATSRSLEKAVETGQFRSDLLARLGQVVKLPPLRERPEDVPLLVDHFLEMYARGDRKKVFADEALEVLRSYPWELNVRQLRDVVQYVVSMVDHEVIRPADLPEFLRDTASRPSAGDDLPASPAPPVPPRRLRDVVREAEKRHLIETLRFTGGNKKRAMELLGIAGETFFRRLKEFGLDKLKGV